MAWAPFPRLPTNEQHLQDRFYVLRLSCLQMIHLARCCERLYKQTLTSGYAWHKYKNKAIYIILSQLHHVHSYCLQTTNFNYIHRKISHQYSFAPRYIIEPIFIWYNVPLCQIYKLWQSDDQLVHPHFWWIWMEPIRLIAKPEICSESDWQVN